MRNPFSLLCFGLTRLRAHLLDRQNYPSAADKKQFFKAYAFSPPQPKSVLPGHILAAIFVCAIAPTSLSAAEPQSLPIHGLLWDSHEMTVGAVRKYAAATGFVSRAEAEGGGYIFELGWTQKKGWNWRQPYGASARDDEPAVHLTFDEAQAICRFFGKRLPKDEEWVKAAYLEQRVSPPSGFERSKRYRYPNGESAKASHCLSGCGNYRGLAPAGSLSRGVGHVSVKTTPAGVNGLYDMGGNVWEWVDDGRGDERITRSASWWYGADRQLESDVATKPRDTRVAYIGFRCVKSP